MIARLSQVVLCCVFVLSITIMLSGCGVKPKTLDAPINADTKLYPKTYPTRGTP